MVTRSPAEFDLERSTDRITNLYRALTGAMVTVETFSCAALTERKQAEQLATQIRQLCMELERLLAVADEGDDALRATVPRRIGVLEREIQTLVGKVQALAGRQLDRVDTGWKR
ncbi:hypothetical protein ACT2FY_39020 [Paraburkholderia fungorum]|uniref:hypothetical protein n=1 Tax=Paraburkholderia fungorum TaxID=134537 RepID=UPI00402B29EC